jgi:hypothetical protein
MFRYIRVGRILAPFLESEKQTIPVTCREFGVVSELRQHTVYCQPNFGGMDKMLVFKIHVACEVRHRRVFFAKESELL